MKKLYHYLVFLLCFTILVGCSEINNATSTDIDQTEIPDINDVEDTTDDELIPILTLDGAGGGIILLENEAKGDFNFEIYVMNADGSSLIQLTNNSAFDGSPNFSPDLSKFVFCSNRSGQMQIYTYDFDAFLRGEEPTITPLTDAGNNYYPTWAPDNSAITFVSDRDGAFKIYKMNIDGSNQELFVDLEGSWFPVWSPDSSKLVFSSTIEGTKEIFIMDSNGGNITRLTNNNLNDQFAYWSPDGQNIVFCRSNATTHFDIYVMDLQGENEERLVSHWGLDEFPIWSPDGTKIIFRSSITGSDQVTVMNSDGTNIVAITDLPGMSMPRDWRIIENIVD